MSYHSEHMRLKPVLEIARQLDIATNPEPAAIFEAGSSGVQIWCTPQDHPEGWKDINMVPGTFSKPCEYMGSVHWKWDAEKIVALKIETSAYALSDQYCDLNEIPYGEKRHLIFNRNADIEWVQKKTAWLFEQAGVPLLPFEFEPEPLCRSGHHILARYLASDGEEYVVLVSPEFEPEQFCQPGFVLTDAIEVSGVDAFPADVLLTPARCDSDLDIEPDEGPLVEQYENASRLGDDDWLEAAYEDGISGWDE